MAGDAREHQLDETQPAPVSAPTLAESAQPRAVGTFEGETAAAPSTPPIARHARAVRIAALAVWGIAAALLVYFIARFVLAPAAPALHFAFIGNAQGRFESLALFDGPYLTLLRMTGVAIAFLATAAWASHHYRHEPLLQMITAVAAIAGVYSPAVAVLTSSDDVALGRALAVVIYIALPVTSLSLATVYPNGRPVPRWLAYVLPFAIVPFVVQAIYMFRDREFSVAIAAAYFPLGAVFLTAQWHRYRRHATVRERYQIKWISYAAAAYVTLQAIAIVVLIPRLERGDPAFAFYRIVFELMIAASYLSALVAVLFSGARYRVWEIDRVINRTLVYAVVSVLLAAVCVVGFFGLHVLFTDLPAWARIALALAVVLALAAPTRRRIARWIDRSVYGIGLDYEALAAKAVRAAELQTTTTELGGYDDLHLLGRGGMGAVYRAHHPDFAMPVALKVISPALARDADAQARFRRESQILQDLAHDHVVPYLASGHEAGLAYIAMKYIDGDDLGALVRRRGPLPQREATVAITGIAAALDVAHARGVVHRDIKPANVLVDASTQRAHVMDFGVALLTDDPRAPDASLVGSLPYIAPEQIKNADHVDHRADIYALGATAYELVTGRPPFVESTALGLVLAHLHQPPLDPRTFAPDVSQLAAAAILKALAKDPAHRFPTAGAFADALALA